MAQYKDELRGTWYYTYIDSNKRHKMKRGFKTKRDAAKAERDQRERDKLTSKECLSRVVKEKLAALRRKKTMGSYNTFEQRYRTLIQPYIEDKLVMDYTVSDIDDYVKKLLEAGKTNKTVNKALITLKGFFAYAIDRDYCSKNPVSKVEPLPVTKTEMQVWSREEFERAIAAENDPEYHAFFETLYWTGMRRGEARALKWIDLDLNSKRLTISRHIDDKSEEVYEGRKNTGKHVITIDNDLFDELSRLHIFQERKDGFAPDTYMFGVIKPLPHQSINNHFAKMVKLSGNKKIRIHDLRHSHVSWLISIGCTPSEAAARIGDSVEQVYRTYQHFFDDQQDQIAESINEAKKKK